MSRNLTLNLGLRWEDHPAQSSGGVGVTIDLVHHAMVLENTPAYYIANGYTTQPIITAYQNAGAIFETPQQAGMPSRLMRNYPLNFDPRFGLPISFLAAKRERWFVDPMEDIVFLRQFVTCSDCQKLALHPGLQLQQQPEPRTLRTA